MTVVEIYPNKRRLKLMLASFVILMIGLVCYLHIYLKIPVTLVIGLCYAMAAGPYLYLLRTAQKVLNKKTPAIILSDTYIEVDQLKKQFRLKWSEILNIEIEKNNDGYADIVIDTGTSIEKFSIDNLDKTPKEIEALVWQYKQAN